jgi:ketosteroid isomerase-like protein
MEHSDTSPLVARIADAFRDGDPAADHKPAETDNVRRLQEVYQAVGQGDFDGGYAERLAEDAELEIIGPDVLPLVGRWQGRAAVVAATRRNFDLLTEQQPELQTVVAQGNSVVVVGRERGRWRATGEPYEIHWVQEFTFRDGKLARIREFFDTAGLLAAVRPAVPNQADPTRT